MKEYKYFSMMKFFPDPGYADAYDVNTLNKLMKSEGWRPLRETPMGGSPFPGTKTDGIGYIFASLVLLERDTSE